MASSIPLRLVWLLGGNGFIGKNLFPKLAKTFQVQKIEHSNPKFNTLKKPDIIINMAASLPLASESDSYAANFHYPETILAYANNYFGSEFKWVQVASYFELQCQFGRKDFYSIDKLAFRQFVHEGSRINGYSVTSIILPHIFGPFADPGRLIPAAINAFKSGINFEVKSGRELLPVLHVDEAVSALLAAIESDQSLCSANPAWYGTVEELTMMIKSQIGSGAFSVVETMESMRQNYPKVIFPDPVKNWLDAPDFAQFKLKLEGI